MPRRKKPLVLEPLTTDDLPPLRRRRTTIADALTTAKRLTEREEKLAARSRATKDVVCHLRLKDYDVILSWAEKFDDDVVEVVRACLFAGMDHYAQVLTIGDRQGGLTASPFTRGAWSAAPAVRVSPAQLNGLPPAGFDRPVFRQPLYDQPPVPRVSGGPNRNEYERAAPPEQPVWVRPAREPGMPSGATEPDVVVGPWTDPNTGEIVPPPVDEPPPP